jgi:hypothetical protein
MCLALPTAFGRRAEHMSASVDRVSARDTRRSDLRSSEGVLFAFVLVLPFWGVVAYLLVG